MNYEATSSRKKILVVDDNEIILQAVCSRLEEAGLQVFIALDGDEAADIALREVLDLIVVDVTFAADAYGLAADGFQAMQRLANLELTHQVPFLAVSAGESERDRERAQTLGVAAFFRKPLGHPDLIKAIQETLPVPA